VAESVGTLLRFMQPGETVADTLTRIATAMKEEKNEAKAAAVRGTFAQCSLAVQSLLKVDEVVQGHSRADLRKTSVQKGVVAKIPDVYVLRWVSDPNKAVHGPFVEEELRAWAGKGFFTKRAAECCTLNAPADRVTDIARLQWFNPKDKFVS
jgi:hypothetical protein